MPSLAQARAIGSNTAGFFLTVIDQTGMEKVRSSFRTSAPDCLASASRPSSDKDRQQDAWNAEMRVGLNGPGRSPAGLLETACMEIGYSDGQAQSGSVRIIAVTNKVRSPATPEVVTAEQAGFPDLSYEAFLGFFGPRSMPQAIRDHISSAVRAVGADDDLTRKFTAMGMKVRVTTPAELDGIIQDERAALARMIAGASSVPAR